MPTNISGQMSAAHTDAATPLRIIDVWHDMARLAGEQRKTLFGYLIAAIIIPQLFFAIFPQATMRGFGALLLNRGMYYSAETPMTAVSLFIIAIWAMTACLFAYWSAVLPDSREEITSEIMTGAIVSLLCVPVALAIALLGVAIIPLIMLLVGSVPDARSIIERAGVLVSLLVIGTLLARFILTGPIMAARGSINPFAGLAASWRMTRGCLGKVMLLVLPVYLIVIIMMLTFLAGAGAVLMATDGSGWHDNGLSIVWILIEALLLGIAMLLPAALYRTLTPNIDLDIFS